MAISSQSFIRDRLTWLAYALLAYVVFIQSMLGPLMPFLRDELHLNYTQGGLLPTLLAVGLILSGLTGDSFARNFGRGIVLWSGSFLVTAGAVLLGFSRSFWLVFAAVLGMGLGSSLTQVMIQAVLADHHGELRSIAITEANVAASLSTSLTPFVIGGLAKTEPGWQAVSMIAVVIMVLLAVPFHREPIPDDDLQGLSTKTKDGRLPLMYWLYWIVIFLVVAVEMSLAIWAPGFLVDVTGLSETNAAFAFAAFPAAMLVGRLAGSSLTRHFSSLTLVLVALGVTLSGFLIFWLNNQAVSNILGLFITGLGVANLYPLILSIAIGLAPSQSNQASARASLGVGLALLSLPLLLGWLADRLGLQNAFGVVVLLILAASAVVINNHWILKRKTLAKQGG